MRMEIKRSPLIRSEYIRDGRAIDDRVRNFSEIRNRYAELAYK